ncbi:hypothetical protein Taro_056591 [Colocasia esculenta]|uniref:Secreted protein n=1 Tax=Colocasia esculenta TaxID=4460 RepID=A0A843XW86_COLES|nr:hypothetical protein [Colocasia esculenta]
MASHMVMLVGNRFICCMILRSARARDEGDWLGGPPIGEPTSDIPLLFFFLVRWVEDEGVRPHLYFRGRLRLFSSEDDSLTQVGRAGFLAEGGGGFLSSSAALPFASVTAPICCHKGRNSR